MQTTPAAGLGADVASILLSDLVDEYEASMRSNAYSPQTVRNYSGVCRKLLTHVGNIYVHNITPQHMDGYFAARQGAGVAPGTLNFERNGLQSLFAYATHRRYLKSGMNPLAHRRPFREIKRNRVRIPAHEFGRLLDMATHPRDRIVVAMGLYLFLRKSEIKLIQMTDLDLDRGEVYVRIPKSSKSDPMPICAELDAELRRWLTWYANQIDRNLRPDDYLVPAKSQPLFLPGVSPSENYRVSRNNVRLDPSRPVRRPELAVQRALERFGVPLRDESGKSNREGVHTLRRSGARALFDVKVSEGYDGAIRLVQAMLHHSSVTTTERYLGIELDRRRRDTEIRGMTMFPKAKNVFSIGGESGATEVLRDSV